MKTIKTMFVLLVITALAMALTACGGGTPVSNNAPQIADAASGASTPASSDAPQTPAAALGGNELPALYTIAVYADFSSGNPDAEANGLVREDVFETEDEPTIQIMANALGRWSGLDFTLQDAKIEKTAAYVVWAADSTLVAGLDGREQKADFHFFDAVGLNWFMMDSLARSIKANFEVEQVFYAQGDGRPLTFSDGQGIGLTELPVDQAYEGSAFFVTHAGGKGDETEVEPPYWNGLDFGPNLSYAEEYNIQGDPGDYVNAAEAAKLTFETLKSGGHIPQYSDGTEYTVVLASLGDIAGEECYIYRLDAIGIGCAYAYQSGRVYYKNDSGAWVSVK